MALFAEVGCGNWVARINSARSLRFNSVLYMHILSLLQYPLSIYARTIPTLLRVNKREIMAFGP